MNVLRVVGFLIHDDSHILIITHHQHVTIALRVVCCVHDQVEVALAVASFLVGEAARAGRDLRSGIRQVDTSETLPCRRGRSRGLIGIRHRVSFLTLGLCSAAA